MSPPGLDRALGCRVGPVFRLHDGRGLLLYTHAHRADAAARRLWCGRYRLASARCGSTSIRRACMVPTIPLTQDRLQWGSVTCGDGNSSMDFRDVHRDDACVAPIHQLLAAGMCITGYALYPCIVSGTSHCAGARLGPGPNNPRALVLTGVITRTPADLVTAPAGRSGAACTNCAVEHSCRNHER